MLGPKPFQLDRLMAIFYSIVEGSVQPTTHIHTQVCDHIIRYHDIHIVFGDIRRFRTS